MYPFLLAITTSWQTMIIIALVLIIIIGLVVLNVFVRELKNTDRIYRIHDDIKTFRVILTTISDYISETDINIEAAEAKYIEVEAKLQELEAKVEDIEAIINN